MSRLGISIRVDRKFPVGVGGIANSDILKSYLGLLVQGKNDFDAMEEFRGDDFFSRALDVGTVPSCSTLRQRMDTHAASWFEFAGEFNESLLSANYATGPVDFGALSCGYMAVDWDTFVMNNSGTQKEAVGRTYQGVDGYTPSATYLGSLGYCLELALRPGVQHSALETELNLERVLPMAAKLTPLPLLFRADSGLCSLKIMREVGAQAAALSREIAIIIKWNPRKTPVETIAAERVADANTIWCHQRAGKRIYRSGYKLAKAGVMLLDLQSDLVQQGELNLQDEEAPDRKCLMTALDGLNERYGRGTVLLASAGLAGDGRAWAMKQERITPGYTTRLGGYAYRSRLKFATPCST